MISREGQAGAPCVEQFLTDDAKTPAGWPNPRAFMTDPVQVARRMMEDVTRIADEFGTCSVDHLTRLGWRMDQVASVATRMADAIKALQAREKAETKALPEAPRPDPRLIGDDAFTGSPAGFHLSSDDIAFGRDCAA